MRRQPEVYVLSIGRARFYLIFHQTCHNGVVRLESKITTANPAVEMRGISWLLVKMGFVVWAEGLGTVIL